MRQTWPKISTIVRLLFLHAILRPRFVLGGLLRPRATAYRAAVLFTTPFASSGERARRTSPDGAREVVFEIGGGSVQAYVWGDPATQPYVLFSHGWSSHGTRFRPWVPALREAGYAVVAFDQAAHGRSSGARATLPVFTTVLLEVGARFGPAAAVVGHSLGGAATALAMARGLMAERAILIAPAADPMAAVGRFARLIGMAEGLGIAMIRGFESWLGIGFEDQQAHRVVPYLGHPALIVHDLADREVPWSEGERYARYWPGARLLSTRGLGHNRVVDDAVVIAAGLRFLRGETVGERVVSSPNLPYGFA